MTKLLKITASVLLLALTAFLFVACGGSQPAAPPTTTPRTVSATPGTASTTARAAGSSASAEPEQMIGQLVIPTDQSPQDFRASLSSRRPVVVLFYMIGSADDDQVRQSLNTLESRYRGQVDFYDYFFSDGNKYGDLMTLLKVNATPSVIMINKQARVQRAWTGYVDDKSLQQGISEILG